LSFENHRDKRLKRAAQMIFLNRTCFNGLYRVNSGGEFNTPAGKYKNPSICNEANLLNASRALRVAEIRKAEFREILKDIKPGSFIYFDPPYRPISKTANFSSYSRVTFGDKDQVELARIFKKLDTPGTKLMLSNSDPKNINPGDNFFDELYSEYHISRIPARRQINSIASRRGTISEIVVTNYPAAKVLQDKKL
jgi:DNA adenine methylase